MPEETKTLEQSVAEAAETLRGEEQELEEKQPEVSEPKETTEVEVDDETAEALELLRALKDPNRAHYVVRNLAQQAGLLKGNEELSKKEEKQLTRSLKDIARKHLGDDFQILSDKIGDILEEVLQEKDQEYKTQITAIQQQQAERELMREYNEFLNENKVTDDEAGIMLKLSQDIAPGPKSTTKSYLSQLLKLTRGEKAAATKSKALEMRKAINHSRSPETKGVEGSQITKEPLPKNLSVRDAVMAAARGISFEE